MKTKSIIRTALLTAVVLAIPLVAMQFSGEVKWDTTDFVVAGVLLFGAGLVFEFLAGRRDDLAYKIIVGIVVATILFLVWAELGVGLFGSPWAGS